MRSSSADSPPARAPLLARMFGGFARWLLADEIWHFAGPRPGRRPVEEELSVRLGRLSRSDAGKSALPFHCRADDKGFLLRYKPSFLGWHLIHRHLCYAGHFVGKGPNIHISGVFRLYGFIRGLQLGLLALAAIGSGLAMVSIAVRFYSYSQAGDSDQLVIASAYIAAVAAGLGFICFLSRLLKFAGNGSRRALFQVLTDLEDT